MAVAVGVAVGVAVAGAVIVNITIISLYIGWRTRREDPQFALLRRWGLVTATWFGTDFRDADLTNATFDNARLKYARFVNATLTGVSWKQAQHLQLARCSGTILADRDVRELLVRGQGPGPAFRGKNLHGAALVKADLHNIDVREAELNQANLSRANLTGAKLYGSAREHWIIDEIQCDYVYWDEAAEERTPADRDFRPGEFEELYKQLPTFEYVFEHGLTAVDTVVMARVADTINRQHPELDLKLDSFHSRGQPHATFTVGHQDAVAPAKQQVRQDYEQRLAALEGTYEQVQRMFEIVTSGQAAFQPVADGITVRRAISADLRRRIVEFLADLPTLQNEQSQRALLYSAGLDDALMQQLPVGQPVADFVNLVVPACLKYGRLEDARPAIEAVLQAAKSKVGQEKKTYCDTLIHHIHTEMNAGNTR